MRELALRLHHDEGGASMLEMILIASAIVIPLLVIGIMFRNNSADVMNTGLEEVGNQEAATFKPFELQQPTSN